MNSDTLVVAGERGWIPMSINLVPSRILKTHWDSVEEGAAKTGRTPSRSQWRIAREVYVGETTEKARQEALGGVLRRDFEDYFLKLMPKMGMIDLFKVDPDMPDSHVTPEYLVDNIWIVGSPDDVTEKLQTLYDDVGGFGVCELPVFMLIDPGFRIGPYLENGVDSVPRHQSMVIALGVVSEDLEVSGESSRTNTPLKSALCHMIQLRDTVCDHEGVVVGHAGHAGSQLDVLSSGQRVGYKQVRGRNVLPHGREVFADPRLVVSETVQDLQLSQIILQGLGHIGARRVQRHHEISEFHQGFLRLIGDRTLGSI